MVRHDHEGGDTMSSNRLVTAATLEQEYGIPRGSAYRMAKSGLIPAYKIGPKRTGLRFVAAEVLEALRCPIGTGDEGARLTAKSQPSSSSTGV